MTVFSKLQPSSPQVLKVGSVNCVNGTCHELIHTWSSSCIQSSIDLLKSGLKSSLKVYLMFYSLKFIVEWKKNKKLGIKESFTRFVKDVLRSTVFLGVHGSSILLGVCTFIKLFGGIHPVGPYISGTVSGILCLLLEKKGRRSMLALYLIKIATEVLYNMIVSRGILTPVKGGGVYLFCIVSAAYMSLFRAGGLPEFFQNGLKKMVGDEQDACHENEHRQVGERLKIQLSKSCITNSFVRYAKSHVVRNFLYGYLIQLVLNSFSLFKRFMGKSAVPIYKLLADVRLAKFLSTYVLLFHTTNCLLRNFFSVDSPRLFGAVAGCVAGSSTVFYRSTSVSLYLLFKMLEIVFTKATEQEILPSLPHLPVILYGLSLGLIAYASVFEPHNIQPSYWKVLLGLTANKFSLVFRKMFEGAVVDSARLYPNFVPNLDPEYVKTSEVKKVLAMYGKWP